MWKGVGEEHVVRKHRPMVARGNKRESNSSRRKGREKKKQGREEEEKRREKVRIKNVVNRKKNRLKIRNKTRDNQNPLKTTTDKAHLVVSKNT